MIFDSPLFLLMFLPLALLAYYAVGKKFKNSVLLIFSLIFYSFGEPIYIVLLVFSIFINYFFTDFMANSTGKKRKILAVLSIILNIGFIAFFKYAEFITASVSDFFSMFWMDFGNFIPVAKMIAPIGISIYTLQIISYIVDVYKAKVPQQKSFINFALYISMFPQMIVGPIVKYNEINMQLTERTHSLDDFSQGFKRFIIGLGKKLLISDSLALVADYTFSLSKTDLTMGVAWTGFICLVLKIYYFITGYSDMAIGLARMFGFKFNENFNYPFIATSVRDFWKRWNISLTSWFKEYVYIPLGGNKNPTVHPAKISKHTYINLIIVFILCGIWHGTNWTFIVWGLYHGMFLLIERLPKIKNFMEKIPKPVKWIYTTVVVLFGWLIFSVSSVDQFTVYLKALFGQGAKISHVTAFEYFSNEHFLVLIIGLIFIFPIKAFILKVIPNKLSENKIIKIIINSLAKITLAVILIFSIAVMNSDIINPFVYFNI